jgi:hypothetical protein
MIEMAEVTEVTLIVGLALLSVVGGAVWLTIWRSRVESRLEKIPVETERSVRAVRRHPECDG